MGLAWGAAWFVAGILVARVPGFYSDLPFAFQFAPFGLLTGIVFSGILAVIEGRRSLDRVSHSRFAGWGAVSGLLLAVLIAALRREAFGREVLVFGPALALTGAVCAAASLALARRSGRATLPGPSAGSGQSRA